MIEHSPVLRRTAREPDAFRGLDRLFEDLWRGFGVPAAPRRERIAAFAPRLDVEETEQALRISAELPGLEDGDFEVSLEGDVLSLKGERREEEDAKREGFHHRESWRGRFERSLRLPFEPDPDAVKASYRSGILHVEVPKPEEARPRTRSIPVSTA